MKLLLDDELRRQLPPIRKIHDPTGDEQLMMYAKFFTPTSGVTFYVAEGEQRDANYMFWGMLIAPQLKFPSQFQISLSRLQSTDWLGHEPCRRDENFQPVRWGDIERTPPPACVFRGM
jgi:hypothetical protein